MVRKAITELYLNVKIRSQEEIAKMNEDAMDVEKSKLINELFKGGEDGKQKKPLGEIKKEV